VLHTWDQQLRAHFHVHALIPSGALSDDGSRWIAGGRKFPFPVRGLSKMFRGKYVDGVERLLEQDELDLPPRPTLSRRCPLGLGDPASRRRLLRQWRRKSWVVSSKAPFAGPRKLVDYLGRYTHRVAISNHRLLSCENGEVTFTYRDRSDGDRRKTAQLPAEKFLGRFLQHVLPDRFVRIHHDGLLGNRDKHQRLARCRELLGAAAVAADESSSPRTTAEWMLSLGIDITRCPCCGDARAPGSRSAEVNEHHRWRRSDRGRRLFHSLGHFVRRAMLCWSTIPSLLAGRLPRGQRKRSAPSHVMPNHWHFVLWPERDDDLPAFMQQITNTHVKRWKEHRHETGYGHLYQGRYKSFPVQTDDYFYQVVRYVERNPLRANLVSRAELWPWSSLGCLVRADSPRDVLSVWPLPRPARWTELVNEPQTESELAALRRCVNRGTPYGDENWTAATSKQLGLDSTLRPRGRPKNKSR